MLQERNILLGKIWNNNSAKCILINVKYFNGFRGSTLTLYVNERSETHTCDTGFKHSTHLIISVFP